MPSSSVHYAGRGSDVKPNFAQMVTAQLRPHRPCGGAKLSVARESDTFGVRELAPALFRVAVATPRCPRGLPWRSTHDTDAATPQENRNSPGFLCALWLPKNRELRSLG